MQSFGYYDASWRLIEEHIENELPSADGCGQTEQRRVAQQVWGLRGLDDAVLRRIETSKCVDMDSNPSDAVYDWQHTPVTIPSTYTGWDAIYYYLTDETFSPRALTLGDGTIFERVDYDAYGRARRWHENENLADFNGINGVTVQDIFDFLTAWLAGDLSADFNGANGVTVQDIFDFLTAWLAGGGSEVADGLLSSAQDTPTGVNGGFIPAPDNPIGYRGYIFNSEVSGGGLYTVRFRHYMPILGRWLERDPAGFIDGSNVYEYVKSGPTTGIDPFGLKEWDPVGEFVDARKADARWGRETLGKAGKALKTVGEGVVSIFVEPYDWYLTAKEIIKDPYNLWSYLGFLPFISTGTIKVIRGVDDAIDAVRHGDDAFDAVRGVDNVIDDACDGRRATQPYEIGPYDDLKRRSKPGDGLDIHHAPQKHPAEQVIPGYNPNKGPSIALPEHEHRLIPKIKGPYDGTPGELLRKTIEDLLKYTKTPREAIDRLRENWRLYL